MKKSILALLLAVSFSQANATVVTFDDLSAGSIPSGYAGFNWDSNAFAYDNSTYNGGYGNTITFPSASNALYNGFGGSQFTISSAQLFNFNGAYFNGWASNNGVASFTATSLTLSGFNNGSLVGQINANISASSFDWVGGNINGIDTLVISQNNGDGHWWLMDNFTVNQRSNVPEPAGIALLGLGLACLGLSRRRKI